MTPRIDCFSRSYGEARSRFLEQAARRGLQVGSHVLPRAGEDDGWKRHAAVETIAAVRAALDGLARPGEA
jgi:hypothetical protein